jgi:hypothetical protein
VEFEVWPQPECPGESIGRDLLRFRHLALWFEVFINAVKRVVDQRRGVADDVLSGPNRIEIGKIGLRNEAQRPCPRTL